MRRLVRFFPSVIQAHKAFQTQDGVGVLLASTRFQIVVAFKQEPFGFHILVLSRQAFA